MILYINACPRENSRTNKLAKRLLLTLGEYKELILTNENISPLNADSLAKRDALIQNKAFDDESFRYANEFANADTIVIAAPFWDMSFPAILKTYLENVYVTGIVSKYSENGRPVGLCNAKKLYYVTTAGGPFIPDFSYDYISTLVKTAFGIEETFLIYAEMLDIVGNDPENILNKTYEEYNL